ncbi:hypothetical protein PIIN_11637 [Serendipita indica DSM 11827]|uniref:Uncharacterized protein n=1 Tax=Serendipita indica (strain DSM 11827) TaxID=1109443 RepID=G4U266_SERID|nr:hypothetical protein PIIN_11637 [Serendipita indica DSM 11827]
MDREPQTTESRSARTLGQTKGNSFGHILPNPSEDSHAVTHQSDSRVYRIELRLDDSYQSTDRSSGWFVWKQ